MAIVYVDRVDVIGGENGGTPEVLVHLSNGDVLGGLQKVQIPEIANGTLGCVDLRLIITGAKDAKAKVEISDCPTHDAHVAGGEDGIGS